MYVPSIGLFVLIAWGIPALAEALIRSVSARESALGLAGSWALAITIGLGYVQAGHWKDSETLFRHTLSVTRDNLYIEYDLGALLYDADRTEEAIPHFEKAIRLRPRYAVAQGKLGTALASLGKPEEAIKHLRQAVKLNPRSPEMHNNLGAVLLSLRRPSEALPEFEAAVKLKPDYEGARANLDQARMMLSE